ncbi:hypothetical protein STANM309S_03230 [Streptomyces tanashiensis]
MQPGGGLVEDVHHAEEAGAQLRGEPQPLELAVGEGGGGAVQAEIAEAEFGDRADPRDEVLGEDPSRLRGFRRRRRGRRERADRAVSGSAASSATLRPAKVTASASGRSRPPPQAGQGALVRKRSAFARRDGLFESDKVRSTWRRALMYVPW